MRLLLTGASGQLGGYLLRALCRQDIPVTAWSGARTGHLLGFPLRPVDLANVDAVVTAFHDARPTTVIHTAALSSVADCYREPQRARQINSEGSALLAELAAQHGAQLIHVSTDMVFDGSRGNYGEADPPAPLSVYGRSKAAAEEAVRAYPRHAVARVSLLFGPSVVGRPSFFDEQHKALREGRPLRLFHDEWRTPLSLATAAAGLLVLARAGYEGILHLGGPERLSRLEMGQRLAAALGCEPASIAAVSRDSIAAAEPRPADLSLDSRQWRQLFPAVPWPTWEEAVRQLLPAA